MQSNFWSGTKYFGTCKRTWHFSHFSMTISIWILLIIFIQRYDFFPWLSIVCNFFFDLCILGFNQKCFYQSWSTRWKMSGQNQRNGIKAAGCQREISCNLCFRLQCISCTAPHWQHSMLRRTKSCTQDFFSRPKWNTYWNRIFFQ